MKNLFAACLCGLLLAASPSLAQTPREAAIGALRNYLSIIAISKMCNFELDKPVVAAVVDNINTLQQVARLTDKDLDGMLGNSVQSFSRTRAAFCAPGLDGFYGLIPELTKGVRDEAAASGVALKAIPSRDVASVPPVPAAKPPQAPAPAIDKDKEAAVSMLNQAIMIETVAFQCKIKLDGVEALTVDRAQFYWRGRANYTPSQFKVVQEFWEADAARNEEKYCAAAFGFRTRLDAVLASVK